MFTWTIKLNLLLKWLPGSNLSHIIIIIFVHQDSYYYYHYYYHNHNYNKIVKANSLSTALISALIGQFNRTVHVMPK